MENLRSVYESVFTNYKFTSQKFDFGKENASILSTLWDQPTRKARRIRICSLSVPGKFIAETLVIYPNFDYDTPIFGTEYLKIGKSKVFGAADFHPLFQSLEYHQMHIQPYIGDFPDTLAETSKFYDLSTYFSKKFWLEKSTIEKSPYFYEDYLDTVKKYLERYKECLLDSDIRPHSSFSLQKAYDTHMAENDPAHGILKAYFSKQFAETYIKTFLFNLCP